MRKKLMRKQLMPYALLVPQGILTLLFIIGLMTGIAQSLGVIPAFGLMKPTLRYYKEVLMRPEMIQSLGYSIKIALISATSATVIGVLLCAGMVMRGKTKGMTMRAVQLPIIVPHVVVALFIINMFAQNGILARVAFALGFIQEQQEFPTIIYNTSGAGIILAYLWKEIPFVIYFVIALMANINKNLGEAAVNLGAGRWMAFYKVTLPLCKQAICSGFLIIFVFALGAYELPMLLGSTTPKALPVLAYQQYTHPDLTNRPYAMALNGIIMVLSIVSAIIYFHLMRKSVNDVIKEGEKS